MWGGLAAPTGFLLCDGSVVSQATYPDLYAAIGANYNTGGEGAGNFRLPDWRDRFPRGRATYNTAVASGGSATETLTLSQIPSHDHGVGTLAAASESAHTHGVGTYAAAAEASHTHGVGSIATASANTDHWHYYSPPSGAYWVTGYAAEVSSGSNAYHLNAYDQRQGNTGWQSAGSGGYTHNHTMSGSTAAGSSHTHTLSGSSGAGSAHTHALSGNVASSGGGGSHNNLPPYQTANFIIKT